LEEHREAHLIRYRVYEEWGDELAIRLSDPSLTQSERYMERIKKSHESSRQNKTGFNDPKQQSASGKKGGTIQTPAKILAYNRKLKEPSIKALTEGTKWIHPELAKPVVIAPNQVTLVADIKPILEKALPDCEDKTKLMNVSRAYFSSCMLKNFKGE
jgi:hypothetical protein